MALQQLSDGSEREGQDDAVGLGELECALDRGLRGRRVVELVVGGSGEEERLDDAHRARRRVLDDGRQHVRCQLRAALREVDGGRDRTQLAAAALLLEECFARGRRLAEPHLRLQRGGPHLNHEERLAGEQHLLCRAERGERLLEAALTGAEKPSSVLHDHAGRGLGVRTQRLRPAEPELGLLEAARPRERAAERRQRHGDDRIARQALGFGERDRLLTLLASERDGALGGLHRQVAEAGDLHPRPADPACERGTLLEVPAGVSDPQRPQFGDAEVHQRRRPDVVAERDLTRRVCL